MYRLFIANRNYSSWSLRPWILMQALAIPFEEKLTVFETDSNWVRFRKFSPNGRVPCLHDGPRIIWDSLAIIEYLAERHAGVWPDNTDARAWARCAASEMHSGFGELRNQCSMTCGMRVKLHEIGAGLQADITRIDELWKQGIDQFGGPYLSGTNFGGVDAFYAPVAFRAQTYGLPLSDVAQAYINLMLSHPAMLKWYEAALLESWRDTAHENDVLRMGVVEADYRVAEMPG